ncbi:uncharacterized protein LOC141850979 [Brevipalpus obovatus]|uniref:uncharacterized protein LOC141850979 n=1 Tax=Brevipalpus obovatus TaxID=246614 RepID=UPI003D9F150C
MTSFWFFFFIFSINFHIFSLKPMEICDENLPRTTSESCSRSLRGNQIGLSKRDTSSTNRVNSDKPEIKLTNSEALVKDRPVTLSDIAADQLSKKLADQQYDSNGVYIKELVDQEKNSQISLERVVNAGNLSEITANVGLDREQSNDRAFKSKLKSIFVGTYNAINVRR